MFYGPSGVGKTETARCLSEAVGGELTRVQFSMMQTQEAYEYLFGAEHSKASFARGLLARESNVVLIDEFDKVDPACTTCSISSLMKEDTLTRIKMSTCEMPFFS